MSKPYPEDPADDMLDAKFDFRQRMRIPELIDPRSGPILLERLDQGYGVFIHRTPTPTAITDAQALAIAQNVTTRVAEDVPDLVNARVDRIMASKSAPAGWPKYPWWATMYLVVVAIYCVWSIVVRS